jgi:hypothetical protein
MRTLPRMPVDPRPSVAPTTGAPPAHDEAASHPAPTHSTATGSPTTQTPVVTPPVAPVVAPRPAPDAAPRSPAADVAAETGTRSRGVRYEARQVQRLITRVDPWSVLKISLLFALSAWLILVVAGVVLWRVAVATGTIGKFENFLAQILAEESFIIDGSQILRASLIAGLVLAITGVVFAVVFSVLFNLISGLTGGLRLTMVELETTRRAGREPSSR